MKARSFAMMLCVLGAVFVFLGWVIDPDPNRVGVYFDTDSSISLMQTSDNLTNFSVYISVTNLEADELHGLEIGYKIEAVDGSLSALQRIGSILPAGAIDVGDSSDPWEGDYIAGLTWPLPAVESIPFVEWQFLLLSPEVNIGFALGPAREQSIEDGLPAAEIGGIIIPLSIAQGRNCMPEGPCFDSGGYSAFLGGLPVSTDGMSFGSVKVLYR